VRCLLIVGDGSEVFQSTHMFLCCKKLIIDVSLLEK
jgi:hypothetical protein